MNKSPGQLGSYLKVAGLALLALFVLIFWYLASAAVSASLPTSGRAQTPTPTDPVTYLCEAPFHTDIALPLNDPLIRWQGELREALPPWMPPDTYLLFGWGDSIFFTSVLAPEDMTPSRAISALAGLNKVAVRIVPVDGPSVADYCRPITIDTNGRRALIEHIRETFERDEEDRLKLLETPVPGEILVQAKGRYSLFNTCNQWTSRALGKAGLPRSLFAPFAWSVTSPLQRAAEPPTNGDNTNKLD